MRRKSLIILVMVAVILVPICVWAQESSFFEDFSDGKADNWTDGGSGRWSVTSGVYQMDSKEKVKESAISYFAKARYGNCDYEAKVRKVSGSKIWYNGLMFKSHGAERYLFLISVNGKYCLWKNSSDGSGSYLVSWTYSYRINAGLSNWNKLRVVAEGSLMKLYINGYHVKDVYDDHFISGGYIGLMSADKTGREICQYDDVKFTGFPPMPTLTVSTYPVSSGKVTGEGIDCGGGGTDCEDSYYQNTTWSFKATPSSGNVFRYWIIDGATKSYNNPVAIEITDEDRTLKAYFRTKKVPVVIIPGIMGSLSSCLFDSSCPKNYEFDPIGPVNETLGPQWVLDPIEFDWGVVSYEPTYKSILQAFQQAGYVTNKTLFSAAYDWRKSNSATASGTLSTVINKAKAISGHSSVDVVCHSMGCLALEDRAIRLEKKDVRKAGMAGPVNHGSTDSYYIWEGGDFSRYDSATKACFIDPLIKHMKIATGYQSQPNYKFIQEKVPSVRQLLPVRNYLLKNVSGKFIPVPIDSMHWRNTFIPTLNYSKLTDKIPASRMRIFAGTEKNTLKSIKVEDSTTLPQWRDGKPVGKVYASGDGTVVLSSAKLGKITVVTKKGAEHRELPSLFRQDIVGFISGVSSQAALSDIQPTSKFYSSEANAIANNFLLVATQNVVSEKESKILMGLTTNEGLRVGRFPYEEKRLKESEYFYYGGTLDKTGAVGIYNALAGGYILTVWTKESETDYIIGLSWKQGAKELEESVRGTIKAGEVRNYKIKVGEKIEISE